MGEYSRPVFGRDKLPRYAIIRAGAHFPDRAQQTLSNFDEVTELKGSWMPYCYGKKGDIEVLIVFNVYGAAATLEVIRLFQDGDVEVIGFIGSAFAKEVELGQQLLVTSVYDQAGIVQLTGVEQISRRPELVERQRELFRNNKVDFTEVTIASVPCVMHNIKHIRDFVANDDVDGVEMELSTYFHFAEEGGMDCYAMIYVSDNPGNPLLSEEKQGIRNDAMKLGSQLLIDLFRNLSG